MRKKLVALFVIVLAMSSAVLAQSVSKRSEYKIEDAATGEIQSQLIEIEFAPEPGGSGGPGGIAQPDGLASVDFTQQTTFDFARAHQHGQMVTIDCEYRDRFADGSASLSPPYSFLGNVILIRQGERTLKLWVDFAPNIYEAQWLIATLPSSKTIRVTYDPDCGLITSIVVTSWR